MKELTKQIRKEVKTLIERVGGTDNILNQHKNELLDKYTTPEERKIVGGKACEVLTTINNQIDYFTFRKGL